MRFSEMISFRTYFLLESLVILGLCVCVRVCVCFLGCAVGHVGS